MKCQSFYFYLYINPYSAIYNLLILIKYVWYGAIFRVGLESGEQKVFQFLPHHVKVMF